MTPMIPAREPKHGAFRRWCAEWFGCVRCFDGEEHDWIACAHIPLQIRHALSKAELEILERHNLAQEIGKAVAEAMRK